MKRLILVLLLLATTALAQAQDTETEALKAESAKLREALRGLTTRMQTAESEAATLKATQTALEDKNKKLEKELNDLKQKTEAERQLAAQAMDELKVALDKRKVENTQLREVLEKWKAGYEQAATAAQNIEGQRANLANQVVDLQNEVEARERNNLELYRIAREILQRYENFGLGKAVLAREPFTGLAKVQLENQIQDYDQKLLEHKDKIGENRAEEAPAATNP